MLVWWALLGYILMVKLLFDTMHNSNKKRFLITIGIGIVLVMGCRYANVNLDGDLNNYYRLYVSLSNVNWGNLVNINNIEMGYLIFNKLLSSIFPWGQTIIFVEAIICIYFAFRFIYKFCSDVFLGVLCYLTQGLFIFQLTGFRQAIAISLCLFSVEYIQKKKFISFLIITLLACSFHLTAIVFIPFYFLANFKPNMFNAFLYGTGYIVLFNSMPSLLLWGSNLTGSDYTETSTWGNFLGPFINIVIYVVTIFLLSYIKNKGELQDKWKWNMTVLGLIVYMLRFVSITFERVTFYFSGGTMVALSLGIEKAFKPQTRKIVYVCFVLLNILLYVVRFKAMPYRFFF